MADATVSGLITSVQASITAGRADPALMTQLSAAVASGSQAMAASRQSRRVGLLASFVNDSGGSLDSLAKHAASFTECLQGEAVMRSNVALDSGLSWQVSAPGVPTSNLNTIGNALITRANAYIALTNATLPA
jgi:hypothetical protein